MLKRTITSLVSVCILLPVLFLSHTVALPIALALVSCIAIYEIYKCIGVHKKYYFCIPAYVYAIAAPFLLRYCDGKMCFSIAFIYGSAYLIYLFMITVWQKGSVKFSKISEFFAVTLYIIAALNSILYIRDLENGGKYLYLLIFIGAWMTDIFAYLTGMLLGKHKLIPEVSPKKTIEGSIGGTLFCVLSFVVFGIVVDSFFGTNANLIFLAISGVFVAIVAQMGDLIMSLIKREYGIKDYGKLFPGHGGVLDRFDSILAVSLMLAIICVFAGIINISLI